MADIKDVARMAEVSISTVSNVMTGKKTVSAVLEKRVLEAVKELGYHASPIAQGMRNSRTNIIGVVISSIQRVFFCQVLKGIQDTVSRSGCVMNVLDSGGSLETEKRCVNYLVDCKADGIILASQADETDPMQAEYIKSLSRLGNQRKRIPVVELEHGLKSRNVDSVMVDNRKASMLAVEHLVGCGRGVIAHITGPSGALLSRLRLAGYREALEKAGIAYEDILVEPGDFTPVSGYQAMGRLLQKTNGITGVFAANDQMAVGAIKRLKEEGKRVPEDVAVTGFDDVFPGSLVSPSLTTVRVPGYAMGATAARRLLQRVEGELTGPGEILLLDTELVVRGSTSPGKDDGWDLGTW